MSETRFIALLLAGLALVAIGWLTPESDHGVWTFAQKAVVVIGAVLCLVAQYRLIEGPVLGKAPHRNGNENGRI